MDTVHPGDMVQYYQNCGPLQSLCKFEDAFKTVFQAGLSGSQLLFLNRV